MSFIAPVVVLIIAVAGHLASDVAAASEPAEEYAAAANGSPQCEAAEVAESSSDQGTSITGSCSLYLAPSTVRDAGLGIYTAEDVPVGFNVGVPDELFVPILDKYKTLPYRGQQRFLSWLGYVWPEEPDTFYHTWNENPFPTIPESMYEVDDGLNGATGLVFFDGDDNNNRVSAFAPGVASLVNSLPPRANIEKRDEAYLKDDDDDWPQQQQHPGEVGGAFTPHHGVVFAATKDISAGSELFIAYGDEWHRRYNLKYGNDGPKEFKSLEELTEEIKHIPTEQEKRKKLEIEQLRLEQKRKLKEEADLKFEQENESKEEETKEEEKQDKRDETTKMHGKRKKNDGNDDQDREEEKRRAVENMQAGRTEDEITHVNSRVEWLEDVGVCVDNIRTGPSTVAQAGRGAFAKNFLSKGSLIAPAPLLALKRDDLNIYHSNTTQNSYRDTLDHDKIVGQELLLNYCYGHPDSPLLLLPYSPIVNYINHDGQAPNAEIRWPEESLLEFYPEDWLYLHPLDVLDLSGELIMEIVALRNISPGEEIFINYGREWETAWTEHVDGRTVETENKDLVYSSFRHEIGVPGGFFPNAWINKSAVYELARFEPPLKPGELVEMKWAHNGEPIMKQGYRVGLPSGFSAHMREYSDRMGITSLFEKLVNENLLDSDDWYVFDTHGEQWYAQRYKSTAWNFNMHYVAAWDETARVSLLREMGKAGFNVALEGIGNHFDMDNLTCFHASFMGVSECDNSMTHADIYATGEKGFNIIFPLIVVNGSKPELDIQSEDANTVLAVNYEYDTALLMGDWGYHKTSPIDYREAGQMRLVLGTYCAQIDDSNAKMIAHLYDGEDPAPFMNQFAMEEIHWGNGHSLPK